MAAFEIDGVRVESYSDGWQVGHVKEFKSGDRKGEKYIPRKRYAGTLEAAVKKILELSSREAETETLEELVAHRDRVVAMIARRLGLNLKEGDGG